MVKHVVMWRYENKDDIATAQEQLESMRGNVPTVLSIDIGVNFNKSQVAYDLVLITSHRDRASLEAYQNDALHIRVKQILSGLKNKRVVADFVV